MRDRAFMTLMRLLPKSALSAAVGKAARARIPASWHRVAMRAFVRRFRVDLEEAEHGLENARGAAMELGADARSAVKAGQDAFLRDRTTHEGAPSA